MADTKVNTAVKPQPIFGWDENGKPGWIDGEEQNQEHPRTCTCWDCEAGNYDPNEELYPSRA